MIDWSRTRPVKTGHSLPDLADRHLWQIAAARDVLVVIVAGCLLWILYWLGDIFLPIFLAFILADISNPFVTYMERAWGWSRPLTVVLLLTSVTLIIIGLSAWLGPILYDQSMTLTYKLPQYLRTLTAAYEIDPGSIINRIEQSVSQLQLEPQKVLSQLFRTSGHAFGVVTFIFSSATYMGLAVTLFIIYYFFFSWHFNSGLAKLGAYVPVSRKEQVFAISSKIDDAVGDFFRRRLLIAFIMGALLSVGWFLAAVPYWFFLGMLTGLLNIVPYLSVISWPIAILLKYVDVLSSGAPLDVWTVVVWPSVVYIAVQFLEGWILTPLLQGGRNNMSAVTVILVIIIGGVVGGVLGMLLAIPIAASVKIICEEFFLPGLRRWALMH
jgi:predicted PurR-regulated permease PerM